MASVTGGVRRMILVITVGCILLQPFATPGVGADQHHVGVNGLSSTLEQQVTPSNNTTVARHENPDTVQDDRDLQALQAHLARQLSQRLGQSSIELSQGQYERARALLGDDYNRSLEKLIDVAGETDQQQSVDQFRQARSTQREFVSSVQQYRETYEAYQEAKQAGNEQRARQLARQLTRIARNVSQQGTDLTSAYSRIENSTGADLDRATMVVTNTTHTIAQQQSAIQAAEFVNTTLSVNATGRTASFDDPLRIHGQLTTTNGTPIANRTVTISVQGWPHVVTTDRDGRFTLLYRPRTASLSMTRLEIRYLPSDASVYLGSNAAVPIRIQQTTASITIRNSSDTISFGEQLRVRGALTTDTHAVGHVPVSLVVGDVQLGTVRTDANGTFRFTTDLPAHIPNGTQNLSVSVAQANRAITGSPATRSIQVNATETALTVAAERHTRSIVVTGRLRTQDGDPIARQSVAILLNGTTRTIVETNASGGYRVTLAPPTTVRSTGVSISAQFSGKGTNLAAARATTSLSAVQSPPRSSSFPAVPIILGIFGGLVLLSGGWVFFRRWRSETDNAATVAPDTAPVESTESSTQFERSLTAARDAVDSDPDVAVEMAYSAVRQLLTDRISTTGQSTHWEWYRACSEAGASIDVDALRSLTQLYERAAYSAGQTDRSTARDAIDLAENLTANFE